MGIIELKDTFFLNDAITLYRKFWDECWHTHKNKQECNFDGSFMDLMMLDYCEYELGHPDDSYDTAAIIWANVIEKNSILIWGEKNADVYLFTGEHQWPKFEVNVNQFVKSVVDSELSQFESFAVLTEKLIINMLISGFQIEDLRNLKKILDKYILKNSETYSEHIIQAIGELYKDNKMVLEELHKILYCK